ncbi:aquaporin-like protein [Tothia fuscella]|uniref:Aquaporin-like protein n=1 Tax=Tothia fuscella TaxID=1048955 RepID=A0A9P4NEF2_9PEZI|nr:aquaporin-like protein [Tothia fuscella]
MPRSKSILPFHKRDGNASLERKTSKTSRDRRLARLAFVPNWVRIETIAFLAEFAGTFMFLFIAFAATQVANAGAPATEDNSLSQYPNSSNLLYISLAFGFSLAVNAWAFFRISGGLFNPAVTLGLYLIGAIKPVRAFLVFIAQMVAAIAAAGVVAGLFPGDLNVATTLAGGTTIAQGLFIEMFLTAELVFVIFMLAAEKHKATFLAPVGIGLALFVSEMTGVYFTGGSLNPARSFGPACITQFPGYHWIYWLGPCMGALLAVGFYELMKFGEYETVNPAQDFDDHEAQLFVPPEDAVTKEEVARPNVAAETAEEAVQHVSTGDRLHTILSESVKG